MRFPLFNQHINFLFTMLIGILWLYVPHVTAQPPIPPENYQPLLPEWVINRDIATDTKIPDNDIVDGIYYRLLDNQINVNSKGEVSHYKRYVQTLSNQTAVESSSQLNLDYDPSYQRLTLHSLTIIRDGQRLDRLNTARYSLIQREQDANKNIYDGSLTLNIIIKDMRIGDTLDYSYTLYGENPVYNHIFSYQRNLTWSVPIEHQYVRILWGKKTPLFITQKNINIDVEHISTAGQDAYQVYLFNQPTIKYESQAPDWYLPYGMIYFSENQSWSEVVNWALPMYQQALTTPASIRTVAQQIANNATPVEQKITAALRYTQDNIRYLGIEMGVNSHRPSAANVTLERRYGDCKDKAMLLVALLKQLDIDAYPVLVNTYSGQALDHRPVSIDSFNHVIVTLQLAGKRYWLDPTLSYQKGALSAIFQPDYGYALIIKEGQSQLTAMHQAQQNSSLELFEHYQLTDNKSAKYSVQTNYLGDRAQNQYAEIERDGLKRIAERFTAFYQNYHASLTSAAAIQITENNNSGVLTLLENYQIADFWQKGDNQENMYFYAYDIRDALYKPQIINRTSPIKLSYPNTISNKIFVDFYEQNWDFDDETWVEDNDYFYFKSTVTYHNKQLRLTYYYHAKQDHIPSHALKEYLAARDKIYELTSFGIVKYGEQQLADQSAPEKMLSPQNIIIALATVYLLVLLYIIVAWRRESTSRPEFNQAHFFTISVSKFLIMSVMTFGLYISYWCYKNWQLIKRHSQPNVMPLWRALFALFWYYPLYNNLRKDSEVRYQANKVMIKGQAILFAIIYFPLSVNNTGTVLTLLTLALISLLYLPMVNYINHANADHQAYHYNSTWRPHNILAIILIVPLLGFAIAQQTALLPNSAVVSGETVWQRDLQYLQRKQVVPADEQIVYFYSDALWSVHDDGNGFTQQRIFSYWKNEQGQLEKQIALFTDVKKIEPTFAQNALDNTLLTVTRKDGSTFILFVSAEDGLDRVFFNSLHEHWQATRT